MSVHSLSSPRNTYPDSFGERDRIFVLVAVDEQPKRIERRIDETPVRIFSRIACSIILLASIIMLGVVALSTVSAVREYERILAAEARI